MRWQDLDADDYLDDREYPDGPDDDDDETDTCPYCLRSIYEDSERCPECGHYLSAEDRPKRYPWWLIVGVLAGLFAVLKCVFR